MGRALKAFFVATILVGFIWPGPSIHGRGGGPSPPPTQGLAGAFRWVRDSGGGKPKAGATVGLDFGGEGDVTAVASQPGEKWTSAGTYSVTGDRIDIDFPEIGWKAKAQPFALSGGVLTLPFQVLDEKPGTSAWEPLPPVRLPGMRALQLFDGYIRQGLIGEEAQDRVAADLIREFSKAAKGPALDTEPARRGPSAPQKIDIEHLTVEKDYRNLYLNYDDGNPSEVVMLRTFPLGKPERKPLPLTLHPIGRDPRSQRPFEPVHLEDNPKKLLAWLLTPNLNSSFYSYDGPVFRADGSTANVNVKGKTDCGKSYGFDPDHHRAVLEWAGYEVKQAKDDEVTLKKVVEALRAEPGLLLISAHGTLTEKGTQRTLAGPARAVPVFVSGVVLYDYWRRFERPEDREAPFIRDEMRRRLDEQIESVKELFPDLPPPGNERRYTILEHYVLPTWFKISGNTGQIWLAYTADFLGLVVNHYKLDFSRSAVVASACDSGTTDEGAKAFRPKVYFGYHATVYCRAAARLEKFLLAGMARPTFSAREVFTRAFIVTGNKVQFYKEDEHLAYGVLGGENGIITLRAYGNELTAPEHDDVGSSLRLARYKPYSSIVFWLMFMNRWSSNLAEGRETLEASYETYWKQKKRPGLANAYAMQGVVGDHYPTEDEVADATQSVTGKSKYREKAYNGRFTLNDGPKRPSFNPPPWDKKK